MLLLCGYIFSDEKDKRWELPLCTSEASMLVNTMMKTSRIKWKQNAASSNLFLNICSDSIGYVITDRQLSVMLNLVLKWQQTLITALHMPQRIKHPYGHLGRFWFLFSLSNKTKMETVCLLGWSYLKRLYGPINRLNRLIGWYLVGCLD